MNSMILDSAVQFLQIGFLLGLIALNFDLRSRLKAIEEKLDPAVRSRGT